MNKYSLLY